MTDTTKRSCICAAALVLALAGSMCPAAPVDEPAGIPVRFSLERAGYVTLVIEDGAGNRVHNLIADTHFAAGEHTVYWDGYAVGTAEPVRDERYLNIRRPRVEPGEYRLRGIVHDDTAVPGDQRLYVTRIGDPADGKLLALRIEQTTNGGEADPT